MSDEVFAKRHEKCEVGERNAFSTSSLVVYTTLHSNELPSPSEWVVTHNMHTGAKCTNSFQSSALHQNHIVLKLSKKS